MMTTACAHCHALMPAVDAAGHQRTYCSSHCTYEARREWRPCARCGQPFHGKKRRKFCSPKCARAVQSATIRRNRLAALSLPEPVLTACAETPDTSR